MCNEGSARGREATGASAPRALRSLALLLLLPLLLRGRRRAPPPLPPRRCATNLALAAAADCELHAPSEREAGRRELLTRRA